MDDKLKIALFSSMEIEPTSGNSVSSDCDMFASEHRGQNKRGSGQQAIDHNLGFDFNKYSPAADNDSRAGLKSGEALFSGMELGNPNFQELLTWNTEEALSITPPLSNSPEISHENGSNDDSTKINESHDHTTQADQDEPISEKDVMARKKAQNRAAQKAFRERKEAKLKELEAKLLTSERDKQALHREIEELKQQNLEIATENRLLSRKNDALPSPDLLANTRKPAKFHFPTQNEFIESAAADHCVPLELPLLNTSYEHGGRKLLTLPATWEYLNDVSQDQDFDVYSVMQNLKGLEICHGHGPAYRQDVVDDLVRQCQ
ncbi:LANO_0D06062g1_1 [Lachancea nothofagi CBS 11611]|uniref:LANO_0D06062g1_1 n=1 Tax=Lachancea nothofagi CBS 11611 TaxID=1266666 RepID=A0A1G4JHL3_9SACH|nr:LANO_0D06062g1_1 [Lachancea nothofagi CBS 11611]